MKTIDKFFISAGIVLVLAVTIYLLSMAICINRGGCTNMPDSGYPYGWEQNTSGSSETIIGEQYESTNKAGQ